MRRREFIALLGGTAAAWPARAQQADRMQRIGVLMASAADDSESQARIAAFMQGLRRLGWSDGGDIARRHCQPALCQRATLCERYVATTNAQRTDGLRDQATRRIVQPAALSSALARQAANL
jgi:hypothetical protein